MFFGEDHVESRKNMSSIYDVFHNISLLSGLGIGRICHIIVLIGRDSLTISGIGYPMRSMAVKYIFLEFYHGDSSEFGIGG
jgi:hypothetical protein